MRELGVTYLHLMPLLHPRPGADDGGYAVVDYRSVRPELGTMSDLAALADALHESGIALTLDLVINHVAQEHEWALKAVKGEEPYRSYFLFYPDRAQPDAFEATLPEVFPDFAPGNFTWVPDVAWNDRPEHPGAWVWTTFNDYQWDLNWSNPDVFCEMLQVILNLANVGVDCFRLDAIAFIWKRLGTNCQGQPEVHEIVQALAGRIAHRGTGGRVQGRSDRCARGAVRLSGPRHARRQGVRPRVPQQLDGADLVVACDGRGGTHAPRAVDGSAQAGDDGLGHVRAMPRRHWMGDL